MKLPSVKQAFFWHFSVSLLVFIVLIAIMMTFWFPGDLFFMDGGWQGLKIIAPIDLILGPALTLIFYRPWKKRSHLRIDIAIIAAVQVSALSYGVYAAHQQRTAAIVFAENRFETISLHELKAADNEMQQANLPVESLHKFGRMPLLVYANPYHSGEQFGEYLAQIFNGLPELRERSYRYEALTDTREHIAEYRLDKKEQTDDAKNATADSGTTIGTTIGTAIEVPASSPAKDSRPTAESYKIKARYIDGIISFDGNNYKIERNGSLFAGN